MTYCHLVYHHDKPSYWHVKFETTEKARDEFDEIKFDHIKMMFHKNWFDILGFNCYGTRCPNTMAGQSSCGVGTTLHSDKIIFEYGSLSPSEQYWPIELPIDIPADYYYVPMCYRDFMDWPCNCCCYSKGSYADFILHFSLRKGSYKKMVYQRFKLEEINLANIGESFYTFMPYK